jgi:hypothetical protein
MNKARLVALTAASALAASALLSLAMPREKVAFSPAEESTFTKHFVTSGEFVLDDMNVLLNGEANDMMPTMEMTMSWSQAVKVVDRYSEVADGRAGVLRRTFEEIAQEIEMEMTMEMMGQSQDQDATGTGTSELEGTTVVFTWNDEDSEYESAFDEDSEGDEELLEGLVEDMDLRSLLPSGDVAEGDEWDIELSSLSKIMAPGGDLHLDIEMDDMQDPMGTGGNAEMMSNMNEMFGEHTSGTSVGRYAGTREVDGVTCRVIEFKFDLESSNDLTAKMEDMMSGQAPEGMDMELESFDGEATFEGEGELLWNATSNRVHAMRLRGDVTLFISMAMSMDMGEKLDIKMTMDMSGEVSQKLVTE